jgi:ADP-ribose pyrophosphatase YjhB (NUDIX family)
MKAQLEQWFRRLRSIAQYGLTYTKDPFDKERFEQISTVASEIAAHLTGDDLAVVQEALRLETGPPTPKLDVRAAVFDGEKILLVRESSDGMWSLPGGWLDVGESPAEAARREVKEESGYDCAIVKLFAFLDRDKQGHPPMLLHVLKVFFVAELVGGQARSSIETTEVGFFSLSELPPLSTARVTREQIVSAYRHRADPGLATEFD